MPFELPPLPYDLNALEPRMSADTLSFHHDKHFRGYVNKLNELVQGTEFESMTIDEIIRATAGRQDCVSVFNNAGQAMNHELFFNSIAPQGIESPSHNLAEAINAAFGDLDGFKSAFKAAGTGQFGSGWVWLVSGQNGLEIVSTPNAETPITDDKAPILVCDVWEHAYYLDYQNERGKFLDGFLDYLVNWDFAAEQFAAAPKS